jgi:hypothetical protein
MHRATLRARRVHLILIRSRRMQLIQYCASLFLQGCITAQVSGPSSWCRGCVRDRYLDGSLIVDNPKEAMTLLEAASDARVLDIPLVMGVTTVADQAARAALAWVGRALMDKADRGTRMLKALQRGKSRQHLDLGRSCRTAFGSMNEIVRETKPRPRRFKKISPCSLRNCKGTLRLRENCCWLKPMSVGCWTGRFRIMASRR